ncbi:MAG: precorrin-4 C(11)-methyltransferase, partial [Bacteroidales bacterium]|nr:precorrin-4 C(11)-methyltransferase [Bacteroidales bacterium]
MTHTAIILVSESSLSLAQRVAAEQRSVIYTKNEITGCTAIGPYAPFLKDHWQEFDAVVFIGALGICVRSIAPALKNKYHDPAVVCIDSTGKFVIPVVSGHVGGANDLARRLAALLGAEAVVTTQS